MKIKRFVAPGMRQAMKLVREDQGPDAVILSTRRLPEGIEMIAAIDYDEALMREAMARARPHVIAAKPAPAPSDAETSAPAVESLPAATPMPAPMPAMPDPAPTVPETRRSAPRDGTEMHDLLAQLASPDPRVIPPSPEIADMRQELGSLREMLETQLASLAWNDMNRRRPIHTGVLRRLTRMDIDADIARMITDALPAELSTEQARYLPLGLIFQHLVSANRQLATLEGVLALVGPTGVGKTTTVAKLAAHALLHHGAEQVALISTDQYRVGAGAQLGQYARLLGIPVFEVHQADELCALLARLRGRRTVLIDSAGVGARDPQLAAQMDILRAAQPQVCATLVLAANAHAQAMDEAVRAYLPLQPQSCILTKLDEAPRLGSALSVLIRHRLPLAFTTDGQRVPEDIAAADLQQMVCRAARGSATEKAVDELALAARFAHASGIEA
ncbi:MAG TPA: flagellar biosynthesis protein FlhF [Rhodanobacteraceae bacterium]|nr:flagellar biosynthesis protein FlhF [Rhodanobacteraceae bacterium]